MELGLCPIPVPHLSLFLSPISLARPDCLPRRLPPLEGGAWLHPRVAELYAPSGEKSWECGTSWLRQKRGTMAGKKVCILGSGNW